eukprot:CAMPEP_0198238618 /NCGR_PEP_ID=MMETSP1446-20131203/4236_1 /TAXON_ID=1461542 ORGANISM="Unidentified sp, Strain CCMP2111" /NCGR_SAMPLE_ID=MMETSP1446 /ASSEMBLY_ACC=CAM_ASM_001112 /LENGTH=157 /DNA_ID=CAMNT_0043921071 /DNA_START=40 /DNA_END=510 /DNA_ORIENTATION=+
MKVREDGDMKEESLANLHFLFEKTLEKALDIVHAGAVKRVVAEKSGRELFQVRGRSSPSAGSAKGSARHGMAHSPELAKRRREGKTSSSLVRDEYLILPAPGAPSPFCSCHSFQYEAIHRGEAILCKHVLAARIAQALDMSVTIIVPDILLAQILLS